MHIQTGYNQQQGKRLLVTMTGEPIQPVRVYYRVHDANALRRIFAKLACVALDYKQKRYVWLYKKEAKKLTFKEPYSSVPREYQPIVIGSFFSPKKDEMYLQTRSIERALEGIVFFAKYIKQSTASVGDISVVNQVFSLEDNPFDYDKLFANEVAIDVEEKLNKIKSTLEQNFTLDGILDAAGSGSLPKVERFPSHFHEDGIMQLKLCLQSRQHVAVQHWSGNVDYNFRDYISGMVGR